MGQVYAVRSVVNGRHGAVDIPTMRVTGKADWVSPIIFAFAGFRRSPLVALTCSAGA